MPISLRRILALAVICSLVFTAALLLQNTDDILPAERPITLIRQSDAMASLFLFGRVYTVDLTIADEIFEHIKQAADSAFALIPRFLF